MNDLDQQSQPISPQDPSSMPRAEDDEIVFEKSPEFHDRPGQGSPGEKRREDWQEPTDSGSGKPSRTTPDELDDVDEDDPKHPGRKPNPTGLQA